jgi:hypothetical protein
LLNAAVTNVVELNAQVTKLAVILLSVLLLLFVWIRALTVSSNVHNLAIPAMPPLAHLTNSVVVVLEPDFVLIRQISSQELVTLLALPSLLLLAQYHFLLTPPLLSMLGVLAILALSHPLPLVPHAAELVNP